MFIDIYLRIYGLRIDYSRFKKKANKQSLMTRQLILSTRGSQKYITLSELHHVPSDSCGTMCCKALNNDDDKWLLLDVNPKTNFLDVQQIRKAQKIEIKFLLKKIPEWFCYKTIDFICYSKLFLINQCKMIFSKKYSLWTPFVTKCSESNLPCLVFFYGKSVQNTQ